MTTTATAAPFTVLGFDFGRQRIGVAVGQSLTATATPLTTLQAVKDKPDWPAIERLIREWSPRLLIVGRPLSMDATPHEMTAAAERFSRQLHGRFGLETQLVDERLSSIEAEQLVRDSRQGGGRRQRGGETDRLAAKLIVETWFNQH